MVLSDVRMPGIGGIALAARIRHIHAMSPRRSRPFVAVNRAAIARGRVDAGYLGSVAGSGPHLRSYGRMESASRGMPTSTASRR